MGLALRTTKERKRKSTTTHLRCKIRICVLSFKEDFGHLFRSLKNSVSDHAEEFSVFLLKHEREGFWCEGTETSTAVDLTKHLVHSESHRTLASTCEPSWGVWTFCENEMQLCSMDGDETLRVCTWR